jgi:hypothetical protein
VSLALEIRQVSNELSHNNERPDLVNRLLRIAARVQQKELMLDDIIADMAQAERLANPPRRPVFKLRVVP